MAHVGTEPRGRPMDVVTEQPMKVVAGGSAAEAFVGLCAVTLAIIGLAGVAPSTLAAVASITAGTALFLRGSALGAQSGKLKGRETAKLGTGVTAEVLGGSAGITLGILALIGIEPNELLPISAIAMGAALVLGAGLMNRLNHLAVVGHRTDDKQIRSAGRMVGAAAGLQVLLGIGAATLGILRIVDVIDDEAMPTLSLIAFLAIGAAALFSGAAIASKASALLKH